ncbi:hypothetical protein Dimus_034931 [Dionaea muscipula]
MDQFAMHFFPQFAGPGVPFKSDDNGNFSTFFEGMLRVETYNMVQGRPYHSHQGMTPLGLMTAELNYCCGETVGGAEGSINHGTAQWYGHMALANICRNWEDNQVSLLINLLRFAFLRRLTSLKTVDNLNGSLGIYDDDHVRIDRDQWFGDEYPAQNNWEWPGGVDVEEYPVFESIVDMAPDEDCDVIDLRFLNDEQARTVMLLTGPWRRRSRYRLDFSLPALTRRLRYRRHNISGLERFTNRMETPPAGMPQLPSWTVVWNALCSYVVHNRLYGQFSVALYMVASMTYQFIPSSAEGNWWLSLRWHARLPKFYAVRGRCSFMNQGNSALASHRALSEWGYVNENMEKVNLISILFSQAYFTGLAVRAYRRAVERDPSDLFNTQSIFSNCFYFISAAATEAVRVRVPLSGMDGVYLYCQGNFEEPDDEREILTLVDVDDIKRRPGYSLRIGRYRTQRPVMRRKERVIMKPAQSSGLRSTASLVEVTPMTPEAQSPAPHTQADQVEEPEEEEEVVEEYEEDRVYLKLPWIPFAGMPNLLTPISPFGDVSTPLSLDGHIKLDTGTRTFDSWDVEAKVAWNAAHVARLCGYNIGTVNDNMYAGGDRFFAPDDVNFVWPLYLKPKRGGWTFMLNGMDSRDNHFISLPNMTTKFFNSEIVWRTIVSSKGVAVAPFERPTLVNEYGAPARLVREMMVYANVPQGFEGPRGYISRQGEDFQFATYVPAGAIPPTEQHPRV